MLRKIQLSFLSACLLFSANCMASNHDLSAGISVEYEFQPNQPELITNITIFPITVLCTLHVQGEQGTMRVRGIKGAGEINSQQVVKGDEFSLPVRQGDKMTLKARAGAQVEFTNQGKGMVKALCKTV